MVCKEALIFLITTEKPFSGIISTAKKTKQILSFHNNMRISWLFATLLMAHKEAFGISYQVCKDSFNIL